MLSHSILSHSTLFYPTLFCPTLLYPILLYFVTLYSAILYSIPLYSILSHFILSHSTLFCHTLFCPILLYSVTLYSILSHSILSHSTLFCHTLFYPTLLCPTLFSPTPFYPIPLYSLPPLYLPIMEAPRGPPACISVLSAVMVFGVPQGQYLGPICPCLLVTCTTHCGSVDITSGITSTHFIGLQGIVWAAPKMFWGAPDIWGPAYVSTVVADALAPNRRQAISSHHAYCAMTLVSHESYHLTHWGRETHICVRKLGHLCFR